MSEELRPCPFCGGELYYTTVTDNPFSYDTYSAGHCSKCHATGPFVAESYLEDEAKPTCDYMKAAAKEKWQTRPIEDALNKRIAELEGLVQQFVWVGNDLIDDNNNPITITLFDALVYKAKEREKNG